MCRPARAAYNNCATARFVSQIDYTKNESTSAATFLLRRCSNMFLRRTSFVAALASQCEMSAWDNCRRQIAGRIEPGIQHPQPQREQAHDSQERDHRQHDRHK